jgi:hypothetical protein
MAGSIVIASHIARKFPSAWRRSVWFCFMSSITEGPSGV